VNLVLFHGCCLEGKTPSLHPQKKFNMQIKFTTQGWIIRPFQVCRGQVRLAVVVRWGSPVACGLHVPVIHAANLKQNLTYYVPENECSSIICSHVEGAMKWLSISHIVVASNLVVYITDNNISEHTQSKSPCFTGLLPG
jgi:hypothetical protein